MPSILGYQPLYHGADGRPCMVVVHDYARDHVDTLKLHHPVVISRGDGPTDTVSITPLLGNGRKYTSTLAERMKPADLTETLLRMWRMPDLTEWYRTTHGASERPVSPPPPAEPPTKPHLPETDLRAMMARTIIQQAGGEQPEVIAADAADDVLKRLASKAKKMSANGNGKH